ncbi:hypothetical protein G7046_g6379 [Stylonectria norvegica]|nr:hypothetical protein G7046_g6379 [Stylonectria norvegica]
MDVLCRTTTCPSSSEPSCSSQAPSTRDSSPDPSHEVFAVPSPIMEHYHSSLQNSIQNSIHNPQRRLFERNQQTFQQNLQAQQAYGTAAPRSVVSPNWRASPAGGLGNWMPTTTTTAAASTSNYMLASPPISRGEVFDGKLGGYAYCLDRGNGQFTRLVPADMLPAMNEIPPVQTGPGGMVILPALQASPPHGVAEMNRPVTIKVRVALEGDARHAERMLSAQAPTNVPEKRSDTVQKRIDRIVATSPVTPKKTKIYCDKWVHEGVCAFTQQGCKYKHEMPFDKATQHSLGLFHGFPSWWKKHQAELERQAELQRHLDGEEPASSPIHHELLRAESAGIDNRGSLSLSQQAWRKENAEKAQKSTLSQQSPEAGHTRMETFGPLSAQGPNVRCVWGPIKPPQKIGAVSGVTANVTVTGTKDWPGDQRSCYSRPTLSSPPRGSLSQHKLADLATQRGPLDMEEVRATLANFAPGFAHSSKQLDTLIKDHVAVVGQLLTSQRETIVANAAEILGELDPAVNSVAFLGILHSSLIPRVPSAGVDIHPLLDHIIRFLSNFDTYQIRYVGSEFRAVLERVLTGKFFAPLLVVETVSAALLRLDPSGSMFTSIHLPLVKFAYGSACIAQVLKVIDCGITFYPGMAGQKDARPLCEETLTPTSYISTSTGLTESVKYSTVLEYNLLCGLCYISRKDWPKALGALARVITHPSREKGVSKIMDDAYKRWILVGLLKDGHDHVLPAYASTSAQSTYMSLGAPYKSVAGIFATRDVEQFKTEIENGQKYWDEDGTSSLIEEVKAAYTKWQVVNLRSVYLQIPIPQLRSLTLSAESGQPLKDDKEVIDLVQDMIAEGMLKGELRLGSDGEESHLVFQDENEGITETAFAAEIARCHQNIESLGKQYQATNERLASSKEYVRHVVKEQKRSEKDGADAGIGFDTDVEDEDLMMDITQHGL